MSFLYKYAPAIMNMMLQVTVALKSTYASFNWTRKKGRRARSRGMQRFLLLERFFLSLLEQENACCETEGRLGSLQKKGNVGEACNRH